MFCDLKIDNTIIYILKSYRLKLTAMGWHEHPIHNPDSHVKIQQKSIRKIIEKLAEVIRELEETKN